MRYGTLTLIDGSVVRIYHLDSIPQGVIVVAPQRSTQWFAIRKKGLTASKCAEYCGCSKDGHPYYLSRQLIEDPDYQPQDPHGNMAMGTKFEKRIGQAFCCIMGMRTSVQDVDIVKHIDFDTNRFMVSPDGLISAGPLKGLYIEIKFSQYGLADDMPKVAHIFQTHMQMNCIGIDWIFLIYGHGTGKTGPTEFCIWLLKRYPPLWDYIKERMERFRCAVFDEKRPLRIGPFPPVGSNIKRDESDDEIPNIGYEVIDAWKTGKIPFESFGLLERHSRRSKQQIIQLFPPKPPYELIYSSRMSKKHLPLPMGPLLQELLTHVSFTES